MRQLLSLLLLLPALGVAESTLKLSSKKSVEMELTTELKIDYKTSLGPKEMVVKEVVNAKVHAEEVPSPPYTFALTIQRCRQSLSAAGEEINFDTTQDQGNQIPIESCYFLKRPLEVVVNEKGEIIKAKEIAQLEEHLSPVKRYALQENIMRFFRHIIPLLNQELYIGEEISLGEKFHQAFEVHSDAEVYLRYTIADILKDKVVVSINAKIGPITEESSTPFLFESPSHKDLPVETTGTIQGEYTLDRSNPLVINGILELKFEQIVNMEDSNYRGEVKVVHHLKSHEL